jgi:hypothetical protein
MYSNRGRGARLFLVTFLCPFFVFHKFQEGGPGPIPTPFPSGSLHDVPDHSLPSAHTFEKETNDNSARRLVPDLLQTSSSIGVDSDFSVLNSGMGEQLKTIYRIRSKALKSCQVKVLL